MARDCPTPEGSTDRHLCLQCGCAGHFARGHPTHAQQPNESWQQYGKGKGKEGNGWKGKGKGKWGDGGKSQGKGQYGKGYGKQGKGNGKRPMSSMDQAQYATMGDGGYDWENGGGNGNWEYSPQGFQGAQQHGYQMNSQSQKAPWELFPGPQDWMGEPEGGAWSFMPLARRQ